MSADGLAHARALMQRAGVHPHAVEVFSHYYRELERGAQGVLAEEDLEPVDSLPVLDELVADEGRAGEVLSRTAVVRLNGGLGTSMGMDRAKSLVEARPGRTFLDLIVAQVLAQRARYGVSLPLLLMNSFRTQADTLAALAGYDGLAVDGLPLDLLQNQEPKLLVDGLEPVSWPANPSLEWCPPGHGDLYTALEASGVLDALLERGYRTLFVSNADNLGAWPDPRVATWFADGGYPFAAEFCRRTPADRKGGHLARRRSDGGLVLRELAQTREQDADAFADIDRHRFFNTNNLWLDLRSLAEHLRDGDGGLGLPLIRNVKTVDPTDPGSPTVVQIETAMGAAIGVFAGAAAIEVDRSRFLPVKATSDLLVLRSDAYQVDDEGRVGLVPELDQAPLVQLAGQYAVLADFDARFPHGAPSLAACERLEVAGDWTFGRRVRVRGQVRLSEDGGSVPDGTLLEPGAP